MTITGVISAILIGIVVGVIGRLILPGKQPIGMLVTVLVGSPWLVPLVGGPSGMRGITDAAIGGDFALGRMLVEDLPALLTGLFVAHIIGGAQRRIGEHAERLHDGPEAIRVAALDIAMFNAAALPGGHIVVFKSAITETYEPDELAGTLHFSVGIRVAAGSRPSVKIA